MCIVNGSFPCQELPKFNEKTFLGRFLVEEGQNISFKCQTDDLYKSCQFHRNNDTFCTLEWVNYHTNSSETSCSDSSYCSRNPSYKVHFYKNN